MLCTCGITCPLFFFHPMHLILSLPFFSLSLLVVTQIRGHITGHSPPSPPRFVPCIFIARRLQLFLPSSTRVELSCLSMYVPTLLVSALSRSGVRSADAIRKLQQIYKLTNLYNLKGGILAWSKEIDSSVPTY